MRDFIKLILVLFSAVSVISCGGETGLSSSVTVEASSGIVLRSPVIGEDLLDPGRNKEYPPNNFRFGFSVSNPSSKYTLYIAEITVAYTYIVNTGGIKNGELNYEFDSSDDPYVMTIEKAVGGVPGTNRRAGMLFYNLPTDAVGPSYDLEMTFRGFFSSKVTNSAGSSMPIPIPEERFEKIVNITVD